MKKQWAIVLVAAALAAPASAAEPVKGEKHYLYVAAPGIRDYLQFGGAGILVFDMDEQHAFVKRIATPESNAKKPDNMKGICACAATKRLYFTTPKKLYCLDLVTEKTLWARELPLGCDRMALTPDGRTLYVPSFEKDTWNVVDADRGELVKVIETKSGAHNTVVSLDGTRMYLGGLKSPWLIVADARTHEIVQKVGPFGGAIRPFVVNAKQTQALVCVNDLLGFEIGDLASGKVIRRVEVQGFSKGPVKRHGCPSHGVGLTPDETEAWVCDAHNNKLHVFDLTGPAPRQTHSLSLREQPGWVTFSLDGRFAYPSTGEVFDVKTKKLLVALKDEEGREVHSEKVVEIHFRDGLPVRTGDQFGVGRAK
jgi:DNA-binding beta-propeller fold protein YncE